MEASPSDLYVVAVEDQTLVGSPTGEEDTMEESGECDDYRQSPVHQRPNI